MKIRVVLGLLLGLFLALALSAASAGTELSAQEIAGIKSRLGTSSADPVTRLNQNGLTAYHVLDWLEDYGDQAGGFSAIFEDFSLLDAYWTASNGGKDQALTQAMRTLESADSDYDNALIRPLSYYHDRIYYAANRLEYILHTLSTDNTLFPGNREALAKEARTLQAQLNEDIAAVSVLEKDAQARVSAAENALRAADAASVAAHLDRAFSLLRAEAQRRQDIETANFRTNDAGASILVISDQEFAIAVMGSGTPGDYLAGATVTVERGKVKKSVTTDTGDHKAAVFEVNDFSPDRNKRVKVHITIETPGRRAIELEEETLAGGQTINLVQKQDDGTPYLKMASFNKKDLSFFDNAIYYTDKNFASLPLTVRLGNVSGACTLTALVGGRVCAKLELTGTEAGFPLVTWTDKWCRVLKTASQTGEKLTLRLTAGGNTYDFDTAMKVKKAVVDEPMYQSNPISPFSPGALTFNLPQLSIPGADGASLSLGIPESPVALTIDTDGSVVFYMGFKKWDPYDWKSADARDREAFQKDYAKDSKCKTWDMAKGAASRDYITDKKPFLGSVKVSINIFAGGIGKYDGDKAMVSVSGSVGVSLTLSIDLSKQFFIPTPVAPIPAFIGFDFSMGVTAVTNLNIAFTTNDSKWDNFHLEFGDETSVGLKLEVGMTLGVGFADIASISVRGYVFFKTTLWFNLSTPAGLQITYQLEYGGGAELKVKFLILKINVPLFTYKGKYPDQPGKLYPKDTPAALVGGNGGAGAVTYGTEGGVTALHASQLLSGIPLLTAADESDRNGVRPEKEILHDGKFLYTGLKTVGITAGGTNYPLTLFLGSYTNGQGVATQKLFYAVPKDTALSVQGLIEANEDGETAYDFDMVWDKEDEKLYTIVAYRGAVGFTTDASRVRIARYGFSVDAATGLPQATQEATLNFTPLNEKGFKPGTGTLRYTKIGKPRLSLFTYTDTNNEKKTGVFFALCAEDESAPNENTVYGGVYYPDWRHVSGISSKGSIYQLMTLPAGDTPIDLQLSSGTDEAHTFFLLTGTKEGTGEDIQYKKMTLALNGVTITPGATLNDDDIVTVTAYDKVADRRIISLMNAFTSAENMSCVFVEEVSDADGNPVRTVNGYTYTAADKGKTLDYGINAAVDWFDETTLNGAKYLYWVQSREITDENNVVDKRYQVFCCLYDAAANAFSAPFTLLQLKNAPTALALADWDPAGGKNAFGLYVCQDDTDSSDDPPSRFVSIEYKLRAGMEINAAVSEYPCVAAGSDAAFLLTVENTGNVPIAAFDARITDPATTYSAVMHVDAAQPENCTLTFTDAANGTTLYTADRFSVYRVPGIYDEYNGESMTQTLTSTLGGAASFREVAVRAVMPDAIHVYKVVMKIPATWKGNKELNVTLENLAIPSSIGNAVTLTAGQTKLTATPLFIVQDSGTDATDILTSAEQDRAVSALFAQNAAPYVPALGALRTTPAQIDLNQGDLSLEQDLLTLDGKQYLQINLKNTSPLETLGNNDRGGPTLTIERDGRVSFTHQFALPLDNRFGYTLLLPLDSVDGGGKYLELTTAVQSAGVAEFDDFDNSETLAFYSPTPAPSPTPGPTPPATGDEQPAKGYAALLFLSLLAMAAVCAALVKHRRAGR